MAYDYTPVHIADIYPFRLCPDSWCHPLLGTNRPPKYPFFQLTHLLQRVPTQLLLVIFYQPTLHRQNHLSNLDGP